MPLEIFGRNELLVEKPVPAWRKFLGRFADTLVILLIIAAGISLVQRLIEQDSALPFEAPAILGVAILNAILGYLQ